MDSFRCFNIASGPSSESLKKSKKFLCIPKDWNDLYLIMIPYMYIWRQQNEITLPTLVFYASLVASNRFSCWYQTFGKLWSSDWDVMWLPPVLPTHSSTSDIMTGMITRSNSLTQWHMSMLKYLQNSMLVSWNGGTDMY